MRWVGTMDGHKFESLEIIVDNEQGLIVERTIALRPYPESKLDSKFRKSREVEENACLRFDSIYENR